MAAGIGEGDLETGATGPRERRKEKRRPSRLLASPLHASPNLSSVTDARSLDELIGVRSYKELHISGASKGGSAASACEREGVQQRVFDLEGVQHVKDYARFQSL
eukprot:2093486-Pleurochrysis_carterae.AAC.1